MKEFIIEKVKEKNKRNKGRTERECLKIENKKKENKSNNNNRMLRM